MADPFPDVLARYLGSGDFNGLPIRQLPGTDSERRSVVQALLAEGRVSVNFGDRHPNPHILAFEPEPVEGQAVKVRSHDLGHACLYPTPRELAAVVKAQDYSGRPFTHRLALGEPQLKLLAFDLRVLEQYRNDPRYYYTTDDIQGTLSVSNEHYESADMRESDQVLLQNFGFGYNREVTQRVVMAFVRDLSGLSSEHQQIWESNRLLGDYLPHPDFWRSMMGEWPERVSVFQAFGEELRAINAMATSMGRSPLFRKDFAEGQRPKKFGFLLRPTLAEYNEFVHLLDKMMSDNINLDFFQGDVELETIETRDDGREVVKTKGSIAVLEEWVRKKFRTQDTKALGEMFAAFRRVRKLRQKPAHAVDEDVFNQTYLKDHRELVIDAYAAVRTLRLILANHPRAKGVDVPEWLLKGDIWTR